MPGASSTGSKIPRGAEASREEWSSWSVAEADFRASENFPGQGEGGRLDQPRKPPEVAGAEADVRLAVEQDRGEPSPAAVDVAHAEDSAGLGCRLHGLSSL